MDLSLIFGLSGMFLLLIVFMLELFEALDAENPIYIIVNIAGSALMAYYALLIDSLPFLILNCVWCLASVYDIMRISLKRHK